MPRSPKGSITRSIPDFYNQRMGVAGIFIGGVAAPTFGAIGLYNNATDGSYLAVWDLTISCPGVAGQAQPVVTRAQFVQGSIGGGVDPFLPLIANSPVQPGQLSGVNPFTNPHNEHWQFPIFGQGYEWPHEWPVAYIPPTYSWVITTDGNGVAGMAVSMIWEVARHV
jgi:hypothetical protein